MNLRNNLPLSQQAINVKYMLFIILSYDHPLSVINTHYMWPNMSSEVIANEIHPPYRINQHKVSNQSAVIPSNPFSYLQQVSNIRNTFLPQYQSPASFLKSEDDQEYSNKNPKYTGKTIQYESETRRKKRLEQNRQSARESRRRKREYIETLETEIAKLKEEINEYKAKLKEYESTKSPDIVKNMKSDMYENVQKFIKIAHDDNTHDLESSLKLILKKFGTNSEERKKVIEALVKEIIRCLLPISQVYLLKTSQTDCEEFNPNIEKISTDDEKKFFSANDLNVSEKTIIYNTKEDLKKSFANLKNHNST